MPFGLTNAPACFQRLINNVLRNYLDIFVTAYLDDIIIYSEREEDHMEHVKTVLRALQEWKLQLKLKKCEFSTKRTEFLGHILEPGRIGMDPAKVQSIIEWPTPKTVKEVQSFLGLGNYYRQFIKGYSRIAAPLTDITRKDLGYQWEEKQEKAFQQLKEAFTTAPVRRLFHPEDRIILETHATMR